MKQAMDRVDSAAQFKRCWRCYTPILLDERDFDAEGLCFSCFHDPGLYKEISKLNDEERR